MNIKEFEGTWENFENYFEDEDSNMIKAWNDSELAIQNKKKNIIETMLYKDGVKSFWKKACYTTSKNNTKPLDSLQITTYNKQLIIEWFSSNKESLGKYTYTLHSQIEHGLEGKVNYLFESDIQSPFKYILLMEPFPSKEEHSNLISHFHFQYASNIADLIKHNKLVHKHWYATMCEGNVTMLDRCNIVLALHKLPMWDTLPL